GEFVSSELEKIDHSLNLLERRSLISELINELMAAPPTAAPSTAPVPTAAAVGELPADPLRGLGGGIPTPTPMPARQPETAPRASAPAKPAVEPISSASRASVEDAKQRIQPIVVDRIDVAAAARLEREELSRQVAELVGEILREQKPRHHMREQQELVELLLHDMLGLGPLEPLLADDSITDILVNGPNQIYVERGGKLVLTDVKFRNNAHVMNVASRIVSQIGRRVDESTPLCDARLQDGSRVNIIIPPLAIDGPSISIRKFSKKSITLDVMVRQKNLSEQLA